MDTITKKRAMRKANELGELAGEKDIQELDSKLPAMKKGVIAKIWDKVLFLWEQAKSPAVPLRLKVVIVGALLYLVLPLDVVSDAIPGLGLLDDMTVILAVVREVSKYALPKIEKKLEEKFYDFSYQVIDEKLSALFSSILINTCITFLGNLTGCIILVTRPFGEPASRYVSITIFAAAFVHALIRFIIYLKNYGRMTEKIALSIYKKKNISQGISDFICSEYKYIAYIFNGIQVAKAVLPELNQIPDAPQIADAFYKHYKNRIILFTVCMIMYSALIAGTKFVLLRI